MPIALATFHAHKALQPDVTRLPARAVRDGWLKTQIRRVWTEQHDAYGSRKVWRQFRRVGFVVARCTVERLMRELNLQGAVRGRRLSKNRTGLLSFATSPSTHVRSNAHDPPV